MQCEILNFSIMMSYLAISLGDWLGMNRQCWKGGGGWANPEGANSMAVSGLGREKPLVGVDRPFILL